MRFQTLWGWPHIWRSSKLFTNIFYEHFEVFWWSLDLCDLTIDPIMSEPHYVKFLFMNLLHSPAVWLFDIWKIVGNSLTQCLWWMYSVKVSLPNIFIFNLFTMVFTLCMYVLFSRILCFLDVDNCRWNVISTCINIYILEAIVCSKVKTNSTKRLVETVTNKSNLMSTGALFTLQRTSKKNKRFREVPRPFNV